jgi:uncharacterized Zn finger protein
MPWWTDYEPTRPRDVKGGVKARSQRGQIGQTWWAKRWTQALSRIMDSGRLSRGRSYARRGQVLNIDEKDSVITARVQGSRRAPYKASIDVQSISDQAWEQVLDVLADQALFTAQLLAGEMPANIEDAFSAAGASLFPLSERELDTDCSCPDWSNPCKHIAAVYFLLGEAFDNDPFMLFRLRGRTQDQILAGLRERRVVIDEEEGEAYDGLAAIHTVGAASTMLPEDLFEFWSLHQSLDDFQVQPCAPEVHLSLLQRMGEPSFIPANITLRSALGLAYQSVTTRAEALAFELPQKKDGAL